MYVQERIDCVLDQTVGDILCALEHIFKKRRNQGKIHSNVHVDIFLTDKSCPK